MLSNARIGYALVLLLVALQPASAQRRIGIPADEAVTYVVPIDGQFDLAGPPADEDATRMRAILNNAVKFALSSWWSARGFSEEPSRRLNIGGIQAVVRYAAEEAAAIAVALRTGAYDAAVTGQPASVAEERALRLIGSIAALHAVNVVGGWGNQWQSADWAAEVGLAGWLLWDRLPAAERAMLARALEFEADRFTGYQVPYYRDLTGLIKHPGDSSSEENAWNARLLALVRAMMPAHPRRALWNEAQTELMLSTYARPSDAHSTTVYHGRPLASWLRGSNLEPDGTVINHGILHPNYMVTGLITQGSAALYSTLAGLETPAAALFNANIVYRTLVDAMFDPAQGWLPPGGTIYSSASHDIYYPQGTDKLLERGMSFALADVYAGLLGLDSLASTPARLFERLHAARVLERQLLNADGRTYAVEEEAPRGLEEWVAARAARAYLARWVFQTASPTVSSSGDGAGPQIGAFEPQIGIRKSTFKIFGAHLNDTQSVSVGGITAKFKRVRGNTLDVTVPKNGVTGPVIVRTPSGVATGDRPFTVISGINIVGRLTEPAGRSVEGAVVTCQPASGAATVTTTDDAGAYMCGPLHAGPYTVTVTKPNVAVIPESVVVKLTATKKGANPVHDFSALRAPYIVGRIKSGGAVVGDVPIARLDGSTSPVLVRADKNGYYGFSDMGPGTYVISPQSGNGVSFGGIQRSVTIGSTGGPTTIDFHGRPAITGKVVYASGYPVEGASITRTGVDGTSVTTTGELGMYAFDDVGVGSHVLTATVDGAVVAPVSVTVVTKASRGKAGVSFVATVP